MGYVSPTDSLIRTCICAFGKCLLSFDFILCSNHWVPGGLGSSDMCLISLPLLLQCLLPSAWNYLFPCPNGDCLLNLLVKLKCHLFSLAFSDRPTIPSVQMVFSFVFPFFPPSLSIYPFIHLTSLFYGLLYFIPHIHFPSPRQTMRFLKAGIMLYLSWQPYAWRMLCIQHSLSNAVCGMKYTTLNIYVIMLFFRIKLKVCFF